MRTLLIALAVVVAVLVAAVLLAPNLIDGEDLKQTLASEVEAATGRKLAIDGEVSVELLPTPALEAAGVRLANVDGAAVPDMVKLRALRVEVALWPLLSSHIKVRRLILVEPVVELEQLADGRANWNFTPQARAAMPAPAEGGGVDRAADKGKGFATQIDDVRIARGAVVWRKGASVQRVEGIEAVVAASSLEGPFRFDGKLAVAGIPVVAKVTVGQLRNDRDAPVSATVAAAGTTAELQGLLSGWPVAAKLAGLLSVRAADPAVVAAVTGAGALPPAIGATPLEIEAQFAAGAEAVAINDMSVRFGAVSGTGAINFALGERPAANIVLSLARVDLDAMLAPGRSPAATAGGGPAAPLRQAPASTPAAGKTRASMPKDFDATVELKVDAITWRGAVIRQTQIVASLAAGEMTLSQAVAMLPGSSDVSAFGFVTLGADGPAFDGHIEANSDNLRGLLGWLGTDVGDVPAERLRKFALASTVKATPSELTLTDVDVTVDTSRIRGGVAVAMRERPGFGIGLSVDRVNLDSYMPDAAAARAPGAAAGAVAAPAPARAPAPAGPLAILDRFDAIVQMKAGALTWHGQQFTGLSIDGTLQGGVLELRNASAVEIAGASVKLAGTLSGLDTGAPNADVRLAVKAPDPDLLARALGTTMPLPLGAAGLDIALRGSLAEGADVDAKLVARGAEATVKGRVGNLLTAAPTFDLATSLSHPDGGRLLGALTGSAIAEGAGALKFDGTAKGTLAALDLDTTLGLGAASLAVAGHLEGLERGAPAGTLRTKLYHPYFVTAVRLVVPGWRPARATPGPLKFAANVTLAPKRVDVAAIDGEFGPVKVTGQAAWDMTGPRPKLVADLQAGEVALDWFLAPVAVAVGAGGGGAAAQSERWPRQAIDFGKMRAIDAALTLTAPAASQGDLRIETPKAVATLTDGVFDLSELSGKVYGGTLAMRARVDAKAAPATVSANMRIVGANAAAMADAGHGSGAGTRGGLLDLVFPVSSVTLASGTLGADFSVDSKGASPFELISNLSGKAGMSFTDAVVRGVDACRVSKQLDNIKGLQGFIDLAGSTRGGQTRIGNFTTSFGIARGVAVLPEQTINAECSAVTLKGTVDLPHWLVDMQTRARLTEHKDFPGVLVEEKGALDQPNIRVVNINEIQQYVAGKGVQSIIRNLAPGQQQAPQQGAPQQPAPQQQPQRPVDRFNEVLQDFLKKPR
ncbi:MAG: AsmA family protein [Alphaproteobacteria bacterium]|nr:AsmA family protein [Alphaproteobacteria bacterium]